MPAGQGYKTSQKQTVRVPLIGSTSLRSGTDTTKDQRYVNFIAETIDTPKTGARRMYCIKRPGLTEFSNPPTAGAAGRGFYSWDGNLYSVFATKVYRNAVEIQTLTTSTGLCYFSETSAIASTPYLALNDGTKLYVIQTDGTVAEVTDGDYPSTNNIGNVVFFDGYTLVAQENGRIWNASNEDPTAWASTDFINAQMWPDKLVSIVRQNNYLVALGEYSVEFFYDAAKASPGSFMERADQAALHVGCAAKDTVVHQEDFIVWLGRARTGGFMVYKLDGLTNLREVSTAPVEKVLNSEKTNASGAYAFSVRTIGHLLYVLTLPNADRTFVYDVEEDHWTEAQSSTSGKWDYVASAQHNGVPMIQGESDGKIWEVDPTVFQDGSTAITCVVQTGLVDVDTNYRKFCDRLELIGDKSSSTSEVDVQYSNDDYQNFSTARTIDMSSLRPVIRNLGGFRRRSYKLTHDDNVALRLESIEMDLQMGEH